MTKAQLLENLPNRLDEPVRWNETEDDEFRWLLECERRRLRLEQFANIENLDDQLEAERIEWEICSQSPQHFIENYVWIEDPHRTKPSEAAMKEMPFVLWPAQVDALGRMAEALETGKDLVITKGRMLGVSWLVQAFALHRFLFDSRFAMRCASRTQNDVEDFTPESLIGKFRFMIERLPTFLRPDLRRDKMMHLEKWDGGRITGEATTRGLARGRRSALLMLDEFAHIDPPIQRRILSASETVAVSRFWVSTPNGPGDGFAHLVGRPNGNVLQLTWRDDPRRTEAWAIAKRDEMGPDMFDQEHEGKIVSKLGAQIWIVRRSRTQYDEATNGFDPKLRKFADVVCGWDFGSGGSRLVCLWGLRQNLDDGSFRLWMDAEQWWQGATWRDSAAEVHAVRAARYPEARWEHFGDPSGVAPESDQESWSSNYQAAGIPMQCLPYSWDQTDQKEAGIRYVQAMLDDGKLMIHERCRYLWDTVERWRRNLRPDQDIDEVDKAYVRPDHGKFSHAGMALVYLIRGAFVTHSAMVSDHNARGKGYEPPPGVVTGGALGAMRAVRGNLRPVRPS